MCLADLGTIEKSLLAMGLLQGCVLSTGKELKLSFTRSKIANKAHSTGLQCYSETIPENNN